jgi:hypothetical protein
VDLLLAARCSSSYCRGLVLLLLRNFVSVLLRRSMMSAPTELLPIWLGLTASRGWLTLALSLVSSSTGRISSATFVHFCHTCRLPDQQLSGAFEMIRSL